MKLTKKEVESFRKAEKRLKGRTITKDNADNADYHALKRISDEIGRTFTIKIDNYIENVEKFWDLQPFFYDKQGLFWLWNKELSKYQLVDDVQMMLVLDNVLGLEGQTVSSRIKSNYLEAFKRVGRQHIPKEAPKRWIQFNDQAFSLRSKKVYNVTPDYFFTNPIPWRLGSTEDTPMMDKLIGEWVGEKYIETMYEIIAYCCYTSYPIHLIICLVGSGRNGKSKFLGLINKFIGNENICSTELDTLLDSRFESFKLYRKLVCSMGETNFGVINKTSLLKRLTGQDLIGFEYKNKKPFDDYNYAKIIISSNSLPTTNDTSEGFYRRWMIIDFPNTFPEGKDILEIIPEKEYNNLGLKVMRILHQLLKRAKFTNQGEIEERKTKYILSSNPLPLFIKKCCEKDEDSYISYNELYSAYIKLLRSLKKRKVSRKEFKSGLEDEGFWVEKTAHETNGIWKTLLNIEGLKLNFANFAFFTNNPTHFLYIGKQVEKTVKKAKKYKNQEKMLEEPIFETIHQPCSVCGTKISHIFDKKGVPLCETCFKGKSTQNGV